MSDFFDDLSGTLDNMLEDATKQVNKLGKKVEKAIENVVEPPEPSIFTTALHDFKNEIEADDDENVPGKQLAINVIDKVLKVSKKLDKALDNDPDSISAIVQEANLAFNGKKALVTPEMGKIGKAITSIINAAKNFFKSIGKLFTPKPSNEPITPAKDNSRKPVKSKRYQEIEAKYKKKPTNK